MSCMPDILTAARKVCFAPLSQKDLQRRSFRSGTAAAPLKPSSSSRAPLRPVACSVDDGTHFEANGITPSQSGGGVRLRSAMKTVRKSFTRSSAVTWCSS